MPITNRMAITDYCQHIENLCFWNIVSYKIGESDSIANEKIGSLGATYQQTLCPDHSVQYTLLNGKCPRVHI